MFVVILLQFAYFKLSSAWTFMKFATIMHNSGDLCPMACQYQQKSLCFLVESVQMSARKDLFTTDMDLSYIFTI